MKDDDQSEHFESSAKSTGDVGFVIDGIDLRTADSEEIESLLFESDDLDLDNSNAEHIPNDASDEGTKRRFEDFVNRHTDERKRSVLDSDAKQNSGGRLPPLWPEDLIPKQPGAGSANPRRAKKEGSTYQHELLRQYKARASNRRFRITSNRAMYFPQLSFTGTKYSGTVTLSQIAMIIMLSARNEALRVRSKEIGCEHLLLGLIENHGFAAGQLLLGLHLNGIGRPLALGDLLAKAKKALKNASSGADRAKDSSVNFAGDDRLLTIPGAAPDMCFTPEAEQTLLESMHVAAQAGRGQVATKHLLVALLGADSTVVSEMLREISITKSEIRNALELCPDTDDSREFVTYFLCSIVHSIVRFRLFPGPVRKYKQYSVKKKKGSKRKKS